MSVADKAVWAIEQKRKEAPALAEIAKICGVSEGHLCRAFAVAFGRSAIGYLRARRLSEAAKALAFGDVSVTEAALDAGYESHAAFSRAFAAAFGAAPSDVRRSGRLDGLPLTEPLIMETTMSADLKDPRFETRPTIRFAGLARRYRHDGLAGVPALWAEFAPHFGEIEGQVGDASYGVCMHEGDEEDFEYLAAVEVAPGAAPEGFALREAPAARYAVFDHVGHVSEIRHTMRAIFETWLPSSALEYGDGPEFERYDHRFDAETGAGVVEIWAPVR